MDRPLDLIDMPLVKRATSGDAAALDRILTLAMRPVYNLALRMLQSHEDAEDATQEVLIRLSTNLSEFRGEARFSTWAWTLASRCILDYRGGKARQARISADGFAEDLQQGLDLAAPDNPEQALLVAQVKLGCCRAMLQCLDGDHRLAYILGEILGLDQAESAAALGLSPANFRKRLSRARASIQALLRSSCGIAASENACRCSRRVAPATRLGRLDPRDAVELDVPALTEKIAALEDLERAAALFRADPETSVSKHLLPRVKAVFETGRRSRNDRPFHGH